MTERRPPAAPPAWPAALGAGSAIAFAVVVIFYRRAMIELAMELGVVLPGPTVLVLGPASITVTWAVGAAGLNILAAIFPQIPRWAAVALGVATALIAWFAMYVMFAPLLIIDALVEKRQDFAFPTLAVLGAPLFLAALVWLGRRRLVPLVAILAILVPPLVGYGWIRDAQKTAAAEKAKRGD